MESQSDTDEGRIRIAIDRPVFSQKEFDRRFINCTGNRNKDKKDSGEKSVTVKKKFRNFIRKTCSRDSLKSHLLSTFPFLDHLKTYQWRNWIVHDLIAGFSVGVIHLPQGLGFALLAGVPPVYGLYTSFLPGWIYYIFGTSRHLSYGTMAVLSLMVGSFVNNQNFDAILTGNGSATSGVSNVTLAHSLRTYSWNLDLMSDSYPTTPYLTQHSDNFNNSNDDMQPLSLLPMLDITSDMLRVNAAAMLTLTVGLLQLLMCSLQLGVISSFMSLPFVKSFSAGAAVHIAINQLPFQLGFNVKRASGAFQLPVNVYRIGAVILKTNMAALVTSITCMSFLLVIKELFNRKMARKLKFPVPAEFVVLVVATMVSHFAEFNTRFNMRVTGSIPNGFPGLVLPSIRLLMINDEESSFFSSLVSLIREALPTAIIGFALAITMAKLMAERHNYVVDSNHELLASGLVNGLTSFFGCIASTQAPPRTLVLESCGCKSQLASLISTLQPLLVVTLAGSLFAALPICVLGSVVSAAVLPLIVVEFIDFCPLWKLSKGDSIVWLICFFTTVFIDVGAGLLIGLAVSGLVVLIGNKGAKGRLLKRAGSTEIYVSSADLAALDIVKRGPDENDNEGSTCVFASTVATVKADGVEKACGENFSVAIFRFECSIYFVNAENFKNVLLRCVLKNKDNKPKDGRAPIADGTNKKDRINKKGSTPCCAGSEEPSTEKMALKSVSVQPDAISVSKPTTKDSEMTKKQMAKPEVSTLSLDLPVKHVILDFSRVADIDLTGLNAIKGSIKRLNDDLVSVSICCCPEKTRKRLEIGGVASENSQIQWGKPVTLYPSIMDAHAFCCGHFTIP